MSSIESLPIKNTFSPADPGELAGVVREAFASGTPLYPIGGGTSLEFGLPAKAPGKGLSLAKLNRVIDYPARDMTVTVEAGRHDAGPGRPAGDRAAAAADRCAAGRARRRSAA